jgi:hypothetical protein
MERRISAGLSAVAMWGLALLPSDAIGQQESVSEQLLGTWSLVSFEFVRQDGSKQSTFGADPKGIAFFDAGGHYIISVMRSGRAHYAIDSSSQGTEAENKATAQGTITYFRTYSVNEADHTIAIHIDRSSFPNWDGADQKRIFAITGDQLKLTAPLGPTVGKAEVGWKRAQ